MKRKSLIIMLLVALFVPLAMNAQTRVSHSGTFGSAQLEMKAPTNGMASNMLLSKIEPAREAALEEINSRGVRAVGDYNLVTASQDDWSGEYVLGYVESTTSVKVLSGRGGSSTNTYGTGTSITMSDNTIASSNVQSSYKVTIAQDGSYYTIKWGSYYLGAKNGNYLLFSTTTPSADTYRWTIAYSNSTLTITNASYTSRKIQWNSATTGQRFAAYSTTQKAISLFKLDDGCYPPEDFAATNVGTTSATLSWTETGNSDAWVIYYMAEDDESSSYVIAETNPYTLTGLEMETVYYALVVPYCGNYDQDSDVITFTTETTCPKPTNLTASDVTMSAATLSWDGEASSYSIRYRTAANNGEAVFGDDFEDASLNNWDWTTYSNGGTFSGYGWFAYDPTSLSSSFPSANSGSNCALSLSYDGSSDITADNYLVTPQVELGGTLKFYVMSNYSDTYEVLLSTGGNAVRDFDVTLQSLAAAPSSWTEVSIDLSRYEGQQGYIAIHHSMYGGFVLFVDDFGIYGNAIPAGDWVTIENVTSPYTITGLSSETEYEWQVLANCGSDGQSAWVSADSFTTGSECDAPYGLTANNVTNSSAALSWTGYTDTYNVQYREYDPDELVTVILTAGDVWGDGSGYQMLLDADATAYDNFSTDGISDYSIFEYLIPTNADYDAGTSNIVVNNSVSIQIPAGTYDCFIANPTPDDQVYVAGTSGNVGGRIDNYEFVAGKTYEFVPSRYGTGDGVDVTITANWTTVSGVTNPYTLSGLTMDTQYEVQVQGANCDGEGGTSDWSESVFFTTLNGTLVESITADDVTVVVGATASITNLTVLPADATNPAVTYTSNDETIATVDDNGVVTGVGVGETTVTIAATDGSGVTGTITVTVNGIDVTGITASDVTMMSGETATITYTVAPTNATDQSVTFTSANTAIATVDTDGVVTGVAPGETTVTIASVSNPEVTAEITVTVTANPDAVQFTVVVPANAQPGEVITVEAYMAAPTSGNYNGFTSLGVHLYYDNTAFEHTADPTYGPVGNSCFNYTHSYPSDGVVRVAFVQPAGSPTTTTGLMFSMEFTVLDGVESGSTYTFYVEPWEAAQFVYNNGTTAVQIPYEYVPSTVLVAEVFTKDITAWTEKGGFYLISSPVATTPAEVTNMLTNTYDLYIFNPQAPVASDGNTYEWENYKKNQFDIVPGKGYLYANSNDVTLEFRGTRYAGNGVVTLHVGDHASSTTVQGMNLVGNPFIEPAYIADGREFYTMNSDGSALMVATNNSIERMEGVFVNAETDGETMQFTTEAPQGSKGGVILNVTQGRSNIDRAIVRFDGNSQLPKFQLFENNSKLYIPQGNKDYAVVKAEAQGELPVNFKADSNGSYTFSVNAENVEFSYLHLIDNMTGADIDLLETPSYSFNATTYDYESRFKLVFAKGNNGNSDEFAFISNGNLIVNGEGLLKVIDMTGRVISTEQINGVSSIKLNAAAGVYVLQLNDMTQKIVVR
ncbi:MAG: DUF2436 domain-containing protein [Bacteroidales bacterium]|nr:DUF2436 domain-containing protein [Bacteroidales bacterium]